MSRLRPYWAIAAVGMAAIALRLAYIAYMMTTPGLEWIDPDGYLFRAYSLIGPDGRWHWTLDAVRYAEAYIKAPLYPLMLSLFAFSPRGYGLSAAFVHSVLAGLTTVSIWSVARSLHSTRAGVIAASAYAVYLPSIVSMNLIMQERLYIPLLSAAMALLVRALDRDHRCRNFGVAGASLGLAALCRSMPVYFVGPLVLLLIFTADSRPGGVRRALPYAAGFLIVVTPYIAFISSQTHRFVLIENIGAYGIARLDAESQRRFPNSEREAPGTGALLSDLASRFVDHPIAFASDKVSGTLASFRVGGGRWLDTHAVLPTAASARIAKVAAHTMGDLMFVVFALLAPFGFLWATRRPAARVLALWIAIHLLMTSIAGYAGQRFREPIDWALFCLGACALAGQRARVSRPSIGLAALVSLLIASEIVISLPASLASRADYGITPWEALNGRRTTQAGAAAGFKVASRGGVVEVLIKPTNADDAATAEFQIDGHAAGQGNVTAEGFLLRTACLQPSAFLELRAKEGDARFFIETGVGLARLP